jgi:NAD(P)-dependent dehydrogenase (short-subunit alcohol dehydrogenase family)
MPTHLAGRTALVSTSEGLGTAIARTLAATGARVAIPYRGAQVRAWSRP